MTKPYNVLLLMTDQHRFDVLGCMGNPNVDTPNLDRIAAEGTVFTHAYTACPSCVPARAILMTGMSQWRTGVLGMGRGQLPMGTNFPHTLPGELAAAGYYCKGVGKMHFFPQRSLNGFHHTVLDESRRREDPDFISEYEQWFNQHKTGDYTISDGVDYNGWAGAAYDKPPALHPNIWTIDESIRFLDSRDRSRPFLLKTSFARPHSPYDAIPAYFDKYRDRPLPKAVVGDWAAENDDPVTAQKSSAWRGVMTDQQIQLARAGYYGNVEHIDHEIGRLLARLEAEGLLDNTMILFTSDHGDMLGDQNMWRKTYAYEGSAHIPMLVRLPKPMQTTAVPRHDAPVMLRDVLPTILDALGLPIPAAVDGLSMLPLIQGQDCQWRDYAHGEHCACYDRDNEMHYLTDGKVKYIWFPATGKERLFDLVVDPYETRDVAAAPEYGQVLEKLRLRLVQELQPRNCGLTDGNRLVCQRDQPPVVSPHFFQRMVGAPAYDQELFRQRCGLDFATGTAEQLLATHRQRVK